MGNIKKDDLWLNAKVIFQDREKCDKMGLEINEEGEIELFLPDVNAIMTREENSNVIVFINGIDLELAIDDIKFVMGKWRKAKEQHYEYAKENQA